MINNLKIYYINLNRTLERKRFMKSQFSKLGFDAIRVEAVDGKELDKSYIEDILNRLKKSNEHYTLPTPAEIAVYLSHKKVWQNIVNQKEDFALVLEDDALIDNRLIDDLDKILSVMKKDEIVDISGLKGFLKKDSKLIDDIELINYTTPSLVIISTIIGKDAAKKMIDVFPKYTLPVDNMLQQVYNHKIKVWITKYPYIKTNYKNLGGSTIQKQVKKTLKDKIKRETLRPFFRLKTHYKNIIG